MFSKQFIVFVAAFTAVSISLAHQVTFHNGELSTLQKAAYVKPIDPQQLITFTVWLKLRNKKQLDDFIQEVYDPKNTHYQAFLTQEAYDATYAPSAQAIQAVESYFMSQGMETQKVYTTIQVTAKARRIEDVLHIKLNDYRYKNKLVYGSVSEPKINAEIAQYIEGFSDLSNLPAGHPNVHRSSVKERSTLQAKPPIETLHFVWNSFIPQATPTTTSLQGFTGAQLRTAYSLNNVAPVRNSMIDGSGQTIVIIDGCGSLSATEIMADANMYNSANALSQLNASNFNVVNYEGSPYVQGSMHCDAVWDGEIALDVEASHTMAPGANIVLVLTDEDVKTSQVATAINTITSNQFAIGGFSNAYVLSNSWDDTTRERQHEPLDATLQTAASMGLSINFAAGDCGDQTYNSSWPCAKVDNDPSVEYPASSAYVTAVGGTSLFVDSSYHYAFESGWGNYRNGHPYSGSMGGISKWRAFPVWQTPISGFEAGGYGTVGNQNRAIPDIAMVADYYTGLIIYQGGQFYKTGGASQSTPLFSGVLTLVNQARTILNHGKANPIGLAAPYFYTFNEPLIRSKALNLITPPHQIISGATPVNNAPSGSIPPSSAFNLPVGADTITFNWDGVLSTVEDQFWNDVVGVGSPNVPYFVNQMAKL